MLNNFRYPKGSEWRKWDLHVHSNASPDSHLIPHDVVDMIIEKEISVFSVTDHSCVDNVDTFRKIVDQKKSEGHNINFLPGIELKTDKGDKSVHL
ncbi:MAG: PHP domain-containing protein, partial [Deltaproteobacteria bacterium]|nr:PHP domain-containing protein [Deltaproteobacteria bacterium]